MRRVPDNLSPHLVLDLSHTGTSDTIKVKRVESPMDIQPQETLRCPSSQLLTRKPLFQKRSHAGQPRLPRRQARPQSACALIPVNTPRCPSHWENKASLPVPYLLQVTIFSFLLSLFPSFLSEGKMCFFLKTVLLYNFCKMQQQKELDFLYPEGTY